MKTLLTCLLILTMAVPAFGWSYGPYPVPGPGGVGYHYYKTGPSPGAVAGIVGGTAAAAALASLFVANQKARLNQSQYNMLMAAVRANQYENYLIALQYYNAYTTSPLNPLDKQGWIQWRTKYGLPCLP